MNAVDLDKLGGCQILDLHAAYGGVRGRTMSAHSQRHAWPAIKEAGVTTVIELRNDAPNPRMIRLCEEFGIELFYFPIDNQAATVERMVGRFPEFCKRIERGGFYIACAMGLHRTDIALSLFWVFYGADNGFAPPELWGYVKRDGHDTSKISRVLNAFYAEWTRQQGAEPFPRAEFVRRKSIITQQSE